MKRINEETVPLYVHVPADLSKNFRSILAFEGISIRDWVVYHIQKYVKEMEDGLE